LFVFVFHPSEVFLFSSSHYNYIYELQFFDVRCWW
jgi:hypothetical protein